MSRTWTALYGSICTSKKLRACAEDSSRLFYLLLLTQADPWGRLEDDPEVLNVKVWPLLGKSEKDTEKALADLHEVGLITRHSHESVKFIQVEDWETHAGRHQGGSRGSPKFPESPRISPKVPGLSGEIRGLSISISSQSESESQRGSAEGEIKPAPEPPPAEKPPKRQKPKTERAPATGPEAEIIQAFEAAFLAKRKATYAFEGGKDGSAVKRLLAFAGGDPRAVIDRIPLLFADEWYGPKATLTMFVAAWNKLPVHKLKAVATPTFDEFEYTRKRLAQEEERRRLASGGGA